MKREIFNLAALALSTCLVVADDTFPLVPNDIEVSIFAQEPLVRNPCAITFDDKGRLCVGMGPQYRSPRPDTPGDSVFILIDDDADGRADRRVEFATGFNSIQGLAWKGRDLWVANAPDMTIVRDLDGDDRADEYVRLWTDLGNLEHGIHGLNWGPDGKLYMSKGNSKGLTEPPDRLAPRPFRELWGMDSPDLPETLDPVVTGPDNYQKNYHNPSDDWGLHGGVLRCNTDGGNLEIISRGFRNPWDITFDDAFDWLGTDNDQTQGDKIFSPFFGAHFGWGHAWSHDWRGDQHLPTAPSNGPLFEGSGTGVIYCGLDRYPGKYRGVFLINDWLRREVYIYRPTWNGAWLQPDSEQFDVLASAGTGRTMERSSGRSFDPVDIEIGPYGAVYISSWGREYGVSYVNGDIANEGRIYRIWPKAALPTARTTAKREKPIERWTLAELVKDLGSHLPPWRANAQEELVRRDSPAVARRLLSELNSDLPTNLETWLTWTLGRLNASELALDEQFHQRSLDPQQTLNRRIQSIRILGHRGLLPSHTLLSDPEARIRFETVLAIRQIPENESLVDQIVGLASREQDRLVYSAAGGALRDLMTADERRGLLRDTRPAVRRAAFLSLLEDDVLTRREVREMEGDLDALTSALANRWLAGKAEAVIKGRPLRGYSSRGNQEGDRRQTVNVSFIRDLVSMGGPDDRYSVATLQPGVRVYGDRNYRFTAVPEDFQGETFIRTANGDAESGARLGFDLQSSAEIFVAHDVRIGVPPAWLRSFQRTDIELVTNDTRFRLFQRSFPSGRVVLGPNYDDGRHGGRSHYVVIVRPKLLEPPSEPATMATVLSLMDRADRNRGSDLFLTKQGAGCVNCHQMEGIGNTFAPDLADIGSRADTEFIIRSILEPSAAITEGFTQRSVLTRAGDEYFGIVIEETGAAVRIAQGNGVVVTVPVNAIERRGVSELSAMPDMAGILGAQQVADLTAFLKTQRKAVKQEAVVNQN